MTTKVKATSKEAVQPAPPPVADEPEQPSHSRIPAPLQDYLKQTSIPKNYVNPQPKTLPELRARVNELNLRTTVSYEKLLPAPTASNRHLHQPKSRWKRSKPPSAPYGPALDVSMVPS